MSKDKEDWAPRPKFTRRFWVGCVVTLFSVSLLIVTLLDYSRTDGALVPWGQMIFVCLVTATGARFALSQGNFAALKARLS